MNEWLDKSWTFIGMGPGAIDSWRGKGVKSAPRSKHIKSLRDVCVEIDSSTCRKPF